MYFFSNFSMKFELQSIFFLVLVFHDVRSLQIETSYYTSNELQHGGASRPKRAAAKSACPYEVQIKMSTFDLVTACNILAS